MERLKNIFDEEDFMIIEMTMERIFSILKRQLGGTSGKVLDFITTIFIYMVIFFKQSFMKDKYKKRDNRESYLGHS